MEEDPQFPHSLLSLVNHGNSDPFNSMAICVTPEASALLAVWKAHVGTNAVRTTRRLSDTTLLQDLRIDEELNARSILFTCSALLYSWSSHCEELQIKRLERKQGVLKTLKETLCTQSNHHMGMESLNPLSLIFMASVLSNEHIEAKWHAEQLFKSVAALGDSSETLTEWQRILLFCRMYHFDDQCALMYMRPPVLKVDDVIHHWEPYLTPFECWVKSQPPITSAVSHPPFSRNLEKIFHLFQEYVVLQCEGLAEIQGHAIWSPTTYSFRLTGLFFEHYEFAKQQLAPESGTDSLAERCQWQAEIVLSLAALAFFACAVHGPTIFNLHQRGNRAMQLLSAAIESMSYPPDGSPLAQIYRYSQLWALHVGAIWEWDSGAYLSGYSWFSLRLQQEVQELNIASWMELRGILDGFSRICSPEWKGSAWFPGMDVPPTHGSYSQVQRQPSSTEFLKALLFGEGF